MTNVDKLIKQLHGQDLENPDSQYKAAIKLGEYLKSSDRERIVEELTKVLNDPKHHGALTRAHAAETLEKAGDPDAIECLKEAATEDDYRLTRSYATRALGKIGNTDVISTLIEILENEDEFFGVRAEAAEGLGDLIKSMNDPLDNNLRTLKDRAYDALIQYHKKKAELDSQRNAERMNRVIREIENSLSNLGKLYGEINVKSLETELAASKEKIEGIKEQQTNVDKMLAEIHDKFHQFDSKKRITINSQKEDGVGSL